MSDDENNQTGFRLTKKDNSELVQKEHLEKAITDATKQFKNETEEAKKQYIGIFGIFAAIITFLIIEVNAFNKIETFSKLAGFSILLLALVLLMVAAIEKIISTQSKKLIKSELFLVAIGLIIISFLFFWYAVSGRVLFWSLS